MRNIYIFLIIFYGIIFIFHCAHGEKDKVNSKLDFNTSEEISGASNADGNKKSPKIQGVRVTVDTGNGKTKKTTAAESGSKESVEIVENKKGKRVGIHTDITFELTDGDEDNNSTSSDKDDTDASVPVYKGRNRGTTHRPRKPYDPKTHWRSNQPHHRDPNFHRNSYNPYPRTNNDDEFYRGLNEWSGFMPVTSVWTTESSYYGGYHPKSANGYKSTYDLTGPQWKPCYCVSTDGRNRRDNGHVGYIKIDDKLESPFNEQQKTASD